MQLKRRIRNVEENLYPPIDIRELPDEVLEEIAEYHRVRAPKQAAAFQAIIKTLPDKELIAMRDGRHHLLSMDTRRRLKHANQTKG